MRGKARIRFATVGEGAPLVLLHGGLGSWFDWYAELPELARTHRVVLVNFRGHGGSTLGEKTFSYALYADDVAAVLDELGIARGDVLGWSDGANAALMLSLRHPSRVGRIIAISANADPGGLTAEASAELVHGRADDAPLVRRLLHRAQAAADSGWHALWARVAGLWRHHPRLTAQDLERIPAPVLYLLGEHDVISERHARAIVAALPDATLEIVPGVGHDVPQTAAGAVLAAVRRFLDDASGEPAPATEPAG